MKFHVLDGNANNVKVIKMVLKTCYILKCKIIKSPRHASRLWNQFVDFDSAD